MRGVNIKSLDNTIQYNLHLEPLRLIPENSLEKYAVCFKKDGLYFGIFKKGI